MPNSPSRTALAAILILLGVLAAPLRSSAAEGPCAADVKKFCSGVQAGGGRIRKCLTEHKSELSAACKDHVGTQRASACEGEIAKFCKDVQPGQGRIIKCLEQHKSELSAACRDETAARAAKRSAEPTKAKEPAPTAAPKRE